VFISPKEEEAYCPQWSPDGARIAFVSGTGGARGVDVARPDGSELHMASEVLGERPSGQLTWSPDGRFLYFDAEGGEHPGRGEIYRAELKPDNTTSVPVQLATGDAPELSPDGSWLAFNAADSAGVVNVSIARPDGSSARVLLRNALLAGWIRDGSMLFAESHDVADGPNGGLVAIRPDGSGRRVVMAFDRDCPPYFCLHDLGWGKPRWVDPFKPS
jgi:Tol biopolymer transport system component